MADLVDWLTEHPDAISQIQNIGDILAEQVIKELDKSFEPSDPKELRRALLDHFWCDLLAVMAEGIKNLKGYFDRLPKYVTSAILNTRKEDQRSHITQNTVELGVQMVWTTLNRLTLFEQIDDAIRGIRILAILICPAPESHPAVARYCIDPLEDMFSTVTKERLQEVFPPDWLPWIHRSLGG